MCSEYKKKKFIRIKYKKKKIKKVTRAAAAVLGQRTENSSPGTRILLAVERVIVRIKNAYACRIRNIIPTIILLLLLLCPIWTTGADSDREQIGYVCLCESPL